MGLFDGAKANAAGMKAYRMHVAANQLTDQGKPGEAKAKYQEALALYKEALRLGINRTNILLGCVILMMREGEFEAAREVMLKLEQRKDLSKDDWFQLRMDYSIYQWKTGQLDKAIESMRRAGREKMNSTVYNTLGMYLVDKARETGEFDEALDFNRQAMDYDDEDAATLDNMAQLYEAMSDAARAEDDVDKADEYRAQAREYYRQARKAKPRQITTLYYLARMYHQDGDDERARKVLSDVDTLYYSAICPIQKSDMDALLQEIA